MSQTAVTQGAHHIGLTVPNLAETRSFFLDVLGFTQVGDKPDYPATFVSDGTTMVTLWQAQDPATATPFDRKNVVGLHHLALQVENGEALSQLHAKLESVAAVNIEFPPENLGGGPAKHMICAIPGGIRMEFIAPQG